MILAKLLISDGENRFCETVLVEHNIPDLVYFSIKDAKNLFPAKRFYTDSDGNLSIVGDNYSLVLSKVNVSPDYKIYKTWKIA